VVNDSDVATNDEDNEAEITLYDANVALKILGETPVKDICSMLRT